MPLRITGKNLDTGDALRSHIESRLSTTIAKYLDIGYSGQVIVEKEGSGFRTSGIIHLDSGVTLEAAGSAQDAHAAFDQAADRLERRLKRYAHRLKERSQPNHAAAGANGKRDILLAEDMHAYVIEAPQEDFEADDSFHPVIVAENMASLHRFSVSEAVFELDLTGVPVVVFRHAGSGRVNIVYRRHDGTIGWIDPPVGNAGQA